MVTNPASLPPGRWRRLVQRWQHRSRFLISALIFFAAFALALAGGLTTVRALLCAFDLAAVLYLISATWILTHADTHALSMWAAAEEGGRWGFLWSNVAVSVIVLVALGLELHAKRGGGPWEILLAASSLLLSWLFLNTMFALHYACSYYGAHRRGGKLPLVFPGTRRPDYWDFLYFAVTIGMTFQVSDVQIADDQLRRLALTHSVIAFFFNVIIVALTVNIVAGSAG